jgi:hypothetical protein
MRSSSRANGPMALTGSRNRTSWLSRSGCRS